MSSLFCLPGPTADQTQEAYIRDRLKDSPDEAEELISSLKVLGVDVSQATPALNEGVLRMDSNKMTLQKQRDFYKDVGGLADPNQAVNLAIETVKQARDREIDLRIFVDESSFEKNERIFNQARESGLGEGTASLLQALTGGVIRAAEEGSHMATVSVCGSGRLRVVMGAAGDYADAEGWALGRGARAAE